jgi:hypothetical protein
MKWSISALPMERLCGIQWESLHRLFYSVLLVISAYVIPTGSPRYLFDFLQTWLVGLNIGLGGFSLRHSLRKAYIFGAKAPDCQAEPIGSSPASEDTQHCLQFHIRKLLAPPSIRESLSAVFCSARADQKAKCSRIWCGIQFDCKIEEWLTKFTQC